MASRAKASTPSTTNAPAPEVFSPEETTGADPLGPLRRSGGSRLTALISLGLSAHAQTALRHRRGESTPHAPGSRRSAGLPERVEIPVDDLVAREQPDDAAESEPG